jgi:hypothetical protein
MRSVGAVADRLACACVCQCWMCVRSVHVFEEGCFLLYYFFVNCAICLLLSFLRSSLQSPSSPLARLLPGTVSVTLTRHSLRARTTRLGGFCSRPALPLL